jgi:acyl carrier protein
MDDTKGRLIQCFVAVFPGLSVADAPRASATRVSEWDSIATLNLTAAVEEEFNMRFAADQIDKLTSFDAFLARLL